MLKEKIENVKAINEASTERVQQSQGQDLSEDHKKQLQELAMQLSKVNGFREKQEEMIQKLQEKLKELVEMNQSLVQEGKKEQEKVKLLTEQIE